MPTSKPTSTGSSPLMPPDGSLHVRATAEPWTTPQAPDLHRPLPVPVCWTKPAGSARTSAVVFGRNAPPEGSTIPLPHGVGRLANREWAIEPDGSVRRAEQPVDDEPTVVTRIADPAGQPTVITPVSGLTAPTRSV
jgi:hypothetical protein